MQDSPKRPLNCLVESLLMLIWEMDATEGKEEEEYHDDALKLC